MCPPLENPDNGDVSIMGMGFCSIATYTCGSGYFLVGSSERVCLENGEWSGDEPSCSKLWSCMEFGCIDLHYFICASFHTQLPGFELEFVNDTPAVNGDTVTIVFSSTVPLQSATCSVTTQPDQDCELIMR